MPYIITTLHPWADEWEPARRARTRRAYATLNETADQVESTIMEHDLDVMPAIHAPDLENGTAIGPLPDGTVIEIMPVAVNWVIGVAEDRGAEIGEDATVAEILEAFNAQH